MQLAGSGVMGPPSDRDGALAVLREAIDLGITHIDTADAYGPGVTNQLVRAGFRGWPVPVFVPSGSEVGSLPKGSPTAALGAGWPRSRQAQPRAADMFARRASSTKLS
jgi:pyridoxine 4-dehydrogenase